jgi:hypothetical protein
MEMLFRGIQRGSSTSLMPALGQAQQQQAPQRR